MGSIKPVDITLLKDALKDGSISFVTVADEDQHHIRNTMDDICTAIDSIDLEDWDSEDIEAALAVEYPNHVSVVSVKKKSDGLFQIDVRLTGPIYNIEIDWEETTIDGELANQLMIR